MAARRKPARRKPASAHPRGGVAPPHPLLQRLALVLLRVFPGAILVDSALYKLTFGTSATLGEAIERFRVDDYRVLVQAAIDDPPRIFGWRFSAFSDALQATALGSPAWETAMCSALLAFELLAGITLVLGLGTRLVAVLAALLLIVFGLAKAAWILTPNTSNWILAAMLLAAAMLAAGRVLGADARLAGRWPRWIS